MSVYDKIFPPKLLTLPNGKQISKPRSRAPLAAVILVAMTALSVEVTGFDMGVLVSRIREFWKTHCSRSCRSAHSRSSVCLSRFQDGSGAFRLAEFQRFPGRG